VIEGTYGFVYCSVNDFGMGVFTIKGERFIGVDSGGVNYDGTAKEQEDGSIVLDVCCAWVSQPVGDDASGCENSRGRQLFQNAYSKVSTARSAVKAGRGND
jgi:hypothetical protein